MFLAEKTPKSFPRDKILWLSEENSQKKVRCFQISQIWVGYNLIDDLRIADVKLRVTFFALIGAQFLQVQVRFLRAANAAISGRTYLMTQQCNYRITFFENMQSLGVPLNMSAPSNPDNPFFGLEFPSVGLNGPYHKPNARRADIILLLYKMLWIGN